MVENSDKTISPQVYIVEASAGSGKTYTLAKKYIQILMNPDIKSPELSLKEILAITFTNKAAVEMKERILDFLKKIALNRFSNKEEENILSSLVIDRKSASERAYLAMDYLIKKYNFFQVQTIDSFINSLLSGCAFKLELSSNFKIKSDFTDYMAYSLDKFVDKAGYDKEILKIFSKFLEQYIYVENSKSWFPKKNILELISSMFSRMNIHAGKFKRYDAESKDLIIKKKNILKIMNQFKNNLPEGTDKRFSTGLISFLDKNKDYFDIEDISAYFGKKDFPAKEGYSIPGNISKLWNRIKDDIAELCELESSVIFNCYIDIFDMVFKDFKALSRKDDILFLEELNREARIIFDEKSITIPELYLRMATKFKHFLIDEFQDTNNLQWKNLFPLVEEALSTGGSLFYVGDKKQAIFRFRGGESSLFDSVKKRFSYFNVKEELLSKNFRSQKEIVEFNNEVFSEKNLRKFINAEEDIFDASDIDEIIGVFKDSKQSYREEKIYGYVKIELLNSKNKDERNSTAKGKLINLIKELKNRLSGYKYIAILTRDNSDIELLTSWLLEEKIPAESEKTLNVRENALIKEFVSFLKFLNFPIDNLFFASFILGDIFSRASGIDMQVMQDFIFDLRKKKKKDEKIYFYREFRIRFERTWNDLIDEFFKNVGLIPLYEFTVSIMNKFNILTNFPEDQGFFMKFLEIIKKKEEEENSGLVSFLEYFDAAKDDDLYVNVSDTDSVKILTIHKSKGLEFPVVIIPFLEIDIKVGSPRKPGGATNAGSYVVYPVKNNISNGDIELLRFKKRYADFSVQLREKYKDEYKKSFIDELNNTYVAFTRAENELYVFIPEKSGNSNNPAKLLIPEENLERGSINRVYKEKDIKKESYLIDISPSVYRDWINFLKEEFVDEECIKNRSLVMLGEVFHFVLSFIDNLYNQDKDKIIESVLKKTSSKFPFINNIMEVESKIKKLLGDDKFRKFFFVEDGEVYQEKEIVDLYGNTVRIDRLIVKRNEVWVIDYKSFGGGNDIHIDQVRGYIGIIKGIYKDVKVRGFLIYIDDLSIEEVSPVRDFKISNGMGLMVSFL